jgi:N-hydroxyarylamine O-acetyltransferase
VANAAVMDVQAYLDRIGFSGVPRPDLATLRALHRGHSLSITYENFDVQRGRPVTIEPGAAFEKIVRGGRGGWCYEQNGLLAAVLEAVGFKVIRLAGAVHRIVRGEEAVGNHLVLLVDLDGEPWIADVGFGDGPRDPYPLAEGEVVSDGWTYRLERLDADWWRFHNHPAGGAPNFDFSLEPADSIQLSAKCEELQTSPASIFVMTAIAQRHMPGEIRLLRGRLFRRVTHDGKADHLIGDAAEFVALLKREFELDLPQAASIWDRVCARHEELFPPQPA